jgi:4-diphosphocytidyl-2-C-methyl-D-erythritol kinase
MICYPNAKINLGLKIISKRDDNFHNIESFFLPIPLFDILEVKKQFPNVKDTQITYSGFNSNHINNDLVIHYLISN